MPLIQTSGLAIPAKSQIGVPNSTGVPSGLAGELLISEILGKYSNLVKAGKVFTAWASPITAPRLASARALYPPSGSLSAISA